MTSTAATLLFLRPVAVQQGGLQLWRRQPWKYYLQSNRRHAQLQTTLQRWRKNGARHYARYWVSLVLAAAAARQHRQTQLQEAQHEMQQQAIHEKPSNWLDWQRRDWTDDLLAQLGARRWTRLWNASCRLVSLSLLAAPLAVLAPLAPRDWTWQYALYAIEQAGPTFLKLAQWATTRHDLFSPEFCQYFGKLRDDTAGHSWKETQRLLQQDLGVSSSSDDNTTTTSKSLADEYLQLDPTPIGSGCIAQVYRGQLLQDVGPHAAGTTVAVKVQHPGILYKVCVDFYLLAKAAQFLESIPYLNLRYLSLLETVQQFRDIMLPQLDLTLEAANLERFNRDFANDPRVSFPIPIPALTTQRVLTETFIEGTPILDFTTADPAVRQDIALLGLTTTLKMIFLHDFLHGDLHPGNILVSQKDGQAHLHLLDCGITIEMGPDQHVNVVKVLGAFTRQDGVKAGQLLVDQTRTCASDWDVDKFVQGIAAIVEADKDQNFVEKVGDYIMDICYLACRHQVKLESSFVNAALAVEIMEGIASALYPDLKVIPVALPLVIKAEMMHRLPKFHLW